MSKSVSSSGDGLLSLDWSKRVEKEVTKINQEDKIKVQKQISAAWKSNAATIKKNRPPEKKVPFVEIPPIVLNDSEVSVTKKRKFAKVTAPSDKNKKTQVSEIIEIEHIPTHPNMITWAPIRRNVLTEDDHYHSNIPYFGDTEIGSNFIKSFEENVNNKMNIFNADNEDSMFMDLVNSLANVEIQTEDESELLEEPKTEAEKKWHLSSCTDNSLPGLVVFQAIAKKYPDYANVTDLIKKFKKLSDVQATTNLVQDLDGPNAQAISAEAAIHSYKSLLCRRCFKYDCPLHNDPFVDEPAKVDKEEAPLPSRPCGPDCFLSLPGVQGLMSPLTPRSTTKGGTELSYDPALAKRVAKKLLGEHYTEENLNRWVNSEITLFRMLAKTFQSNWCAIAQGVMTKTCKQVYEFSKQELGNAVNNKKKSSSLPRRQGNKTGKKKHTKAKQAALYKGHSKDGERESTMPYTPCHHPGLPCTDDICTCRQTGNFCEKFCYCPPDCRMRFPGCKCKSKCTTNQCACFKACRECDPDLCTTCLDGNIEFNPDTNSCRNVMVQRELGKKLFVAPSDIAGWGCFLGERANKNEFIAEYLGEMISQEESERRGKIYDKAKCSYMFNLNEEFCVDAARMGGKIRFANHSSKPNCKVKILMVNGDHRIGIYANKPIEEGEELFFDYGKDFHGHDIV